MAPFTAPPVAARVRGNRLFGADGQPWVIAGVALSGLEYACNGVGSDQPATFLAMRQWHVNTVRIAVSSRFWLNTDGTCPTYQTTLHAAIMNAESAGLHVIIELHAVSDNHSEMPDAEALQFWEQFLPAYRDDPELMVELFNEPHDVSWDVWYSGGMVYPASGQDYLAIGMQHLVDVANSLAPHVPVIVSGLSWEYDYSGMRADLVLHGKNLIYGVHIYNFPGKQPQDWQSAFAFLVPHVPILITEFGDTTQCDGSWLAQNDAEDAKYRHWHDCWAWLPSENDCDYPSVISDWSGTPSSYGQSIYNFYRQAFPAR